MKLNGITRETRHVPLFGRILARTRVSSSVGVSLLPRITIFLAFQALITRYVREVHTGPAELLVSSCAKTVIQHVHLRREQTPPLSSASSSRITRTTTLDNQTYDVVTGNVPTAHAGHVNDNCIDRCPFALTYCDPPLAPFAQPTLYFPDYACFGF